MPGTAGGKVRVADAWENWYNGGKIPGWKRPKMGIRNERVKENMKRECGMLLPVASLPSNYGIGAFSKEAYEFVDRLAEAGQQYWQILPLGPTG